MHMTKLHNAWMQALPTGSEKAQPVQPRSLSAMRIDPAVLSAVKLKQNSSPKLSDAHASRKEDSKVSKDIYNAWPVYAEPLLTSGLLTVWAQHSRRNHCSIA